MALLHIIISRVRMDEVIEDVLEGNANAVPGIPIDWERLDFLGDTRTDTEKFQDQWPNFDHAFYIELAKQEEEAKLREKKANVARFGLLIERGRFLISFS